MKKYYLFGAGSNCNSAIGYCGKNNLIAIIDNNPDKAGKIYADVPIISFENFKRYYCGEKVIITAYLYQEELRKQLEENAINNYIVFPLIQTSWYSTHKITEIYKLNQFCKIATIGNPELSEILIDSLDMVENSYIRERMNLSEWKHALKDTEVVLIMDDISDAEIWENIINNKYIDVYKESQKKFQEKYNRLKVFKDKYVNQKCFLIGNGPSLTSEDLEQLYKNEIISFACNRIYLVYNQTKWRPNYYFLIDGKEFQHNRSELNRENQISFVKDFIGMDINAEEKNVYSFRNVESDFYPGYPLFSADMDKCLYGGRSTMYQMLQTAVYMGFSEIYLLGVDFTFGEGGSNTHFASNYIDRNSIIKFSNSRDKLMHAYISARRYADAHGIHIYNATRGGKLEVFERVDFDKIFDRSN